MNDKTRLNLFRGFPGDSAGKESAAMQETPVQLQGQGIPLVEETGYLLQYTWASLVAQMVKNLPAMRETCVRPLGLWVET